MSQLRTTVENGVGVLQLDNPARRNANLTQRGLFHERTPAGLQKLKSGQSRATERSL